MVSKGFSDRAMESIIGKRTFEGGKTGSLEENKTNEIYLIKRLSELSSG